MTIRRRSRAVLALVTTTALLLAACGTRLDHASIVRGATAAGASADSSGQALPGEAAVPGALDAGEGGVLPDGTAAGAAAGTPGTPGGAAGGKTDGAAGNPNGGAKGSGPGGGAIVIGTVGTYSGPQGAAYAQAPRALQAWAAATNAQGGINGRKIQVNVYDDAGDSSKARSQVQELVEQRKAAAIVASFSPSTLPAWKKYVEDKKVPVIGGSCSLHWNSSPALFPQCASLDTLAFGMAKVGASVGAGKKFGGLFCTEASDCTYVEDLYFSKGVAKQAGLEPVYRARISLTQPDFTSECIQARNAGVQIFTVIADPNTLARVGASCRRQNFSPQFISAGFLVDAKSPQQPGLENLALTMGAFPFEGLSTPAAKEFADAWRKYGGGAAPAPTASYTWASAKLFEKAARAAGAQAGTSAGILKGLSTIRNERLGGLTVPLTFSAGKPASDAGCWFVMRAAGGKWTAPQGDRPSCR